MTKKTALVLALSGHFHLISYRFAPFCMPFFVLFFFFFFVCKDIVGQWAGTMIGFNTQRGENGGRKIFGL